MKNNSKYKGNINSTSVIIFPIRRQKLPVMVLCEKVFVMLLLIISFLYLHFVAVLHLSMYFIHIFFSTSSLTLPWTIARFLQIFYTFSPAHRRVIRNTFIFNHSVNLPAASATALTGHFLPTGVFYLMPLH